MVSAEDVSAVSNAESNRWTWTLGLLTAASACLVPVGADAAASGADGVEASSCPCEAAALAGLVDVAVQVDHRTERRTTAGEASRRDRSEPDRRLPLRNLVRIRSQLLLEPGPPIYLVAPSQSPPGSP